MMMAIRAYTKKVRAPEKGVMVGVRLQEPQLHAIDKWVREQDNQISRPEAIRRLIQFGLRAKTDRSKSRTELDDDEVNAS